MKIDKKKLDDLEREEAEKLYLELSGENALPEDIKLDEYFTQAADMKQEYSKFDEILSALEPEASDDEQDT